MEDQGNFAGSNPIQNTKKELSGGAVAPKVNGPGANIPQTTSTDEQKDDQKKAVGCSRTCVYLGIGALLVAIIIAVVVVVVVVTGDDDDVDNSSGAVSQ